MAALDNLVTIGPIATRPWVIREGDNVALQFIVKYNGAAVDMTTVTGVCSIRANYDSTTDIAVGTVTFPTPASGIVRVTLAASLTTAVAAAIPAGTSVDLLQVPVGYYDIELQDGTNQVTILGGQVSTSREITP